MAGEELVRVLDFILNRCGEAEIEAVAAAVVRRRRDISLFGAASAAPDPRRFAKEMSEQLNIEGSIESLKKSVRDYAIRIIKQEAPELSAAQIEELTKAWIPGENGAKKNKKAAGPGSMPKEALSSMIDQFVSFSLGRMEEEEDEALRMEIGPWPDKYWKTFPKVIRLIITDFLKGEIEEAEFSSRIGLAMQTR